MQPAMLASERTIVGVVRKEDPLTIAGPLVMILYV